jgi:site-specific DNA recombinase
MIWSGGGIPYGYEYDYKRKRLVVKDEELKVLKKIFDLAIQGAGVKEIANTLNALGLKSRRGKKWSVTVVSALLLPARLKFYRGFDPSGAPGNWEAIISEEEYQKLLKLKDSKVTPPKVYNRENYLLTNIGILYCGYCGGTAKAVKVKKTRNLFLYYLCTQKQTRGSSQCPRSKSIPQEIIDNTVIKQIRYYTSSPMREKIIRYIEDYRNQLFDSLKNLPSMYQEAIMNNNISLLMDNHRRASDLISNTYEKYSDVALPTPPESEDKMQDIILANINKIELLNEEIIITYKFPINQNMNFAERIKF